MGIRELQFVRFAEIHKMPILILSEQFAKHWKIQAGKDRSKVAQSRTRYVASDFRAP